MFEKGKTYNRREDLHKIYGGQMQGGISTPSQYAFVMLFTGTSGEQYGYKDAWNDEGLYLYTGEGQEGDMVFKRGNLAIRDHEANGKALHLFEYVRIGHVSYVGQMVYESHQIISAGDVNDNIRRIIVFVLRPVER